ncbi:hypothetical protein U1Q18_051717, partial [Sarracenia purpurea var. burkii]
MSYLRNISKLMSGMTDIANDAAKQMVKYLSGIANVANDGAPLINRGLLLPEKKMDWSSRKMALGVV